jgi:membrane-associated protease RseP (regulator of RpoE activity)
VVDQMHGGIGVGSSVLFALTAKFALGDTLAEGHLLALHPLAFAGWLGLLVTALNLLPIGQLDGGHMADAMFGRVRSAAIGTAALLALVLLGLFVWSGLLTWALIVYFIAGGKGLPPLNDVSKMGGGRLAIGAFAFVLLFLILAPIPHRLYQALGIHCPYL